MTLPTLLERCHCIGCPESAKHIVTISEKHIVTISDKERCYVVGRICDKCLVTFLLDETLSVRTGRWVT